MIGGFRVYEWWLEGLERLGFGGVSGIGRGYKGFGWFEGDL